jgi:hypothetical protein
MQISVEEKRSSAYITEQAVSLLNQPNWKVTGALKNMDNLTVCEMWWDHFVWMNICVE